MYLYWFTINSFQALKLSLIGSKRNDNNKNRNYIVYNFLTAIL